MSHQVKSGMLKQLQKLQPKLLLFTFGASLLPAMLLTAVAWQFVQKPLIDLEKTRLDDQVLAFRGYTAATEKGLQNLTSGYAIWTDLFNAIAQQNRAWLKKEVADQLILSTDVDAVQIVSLQGEILGEAGDALRLPTVASRVTPLVASGKTAIELIDTSDRELLILSIAPIYKTDRTGNPPGTIILGQKMDETWLRNFLNFSQPTTKLQVISLDGKRIISSNTQASSDGWEATNLSKQVLPAIQKSEPVYRIEPNSGLNTIYAPITSQNKPVAIAKIQIVSKYFNRATVTLNRLIWISLGLASLLSFAIARLLAQQIGEPIILLAKRSKTLAEGDLTAPIPGVSAGGEIGQLANAYQEMAQALKTLIDNLEQRVAERTQELEEERNTLEERVYKRTQEFWKKNYQLQQAHDQLQLLNTELIAQANQLREALGSLKIAQVQLIQTEKMSSLGQLVAGIAHEINNPINFIYANLIYVTDYTQNLLSLVQRYQQSYTDPQIEKYTEEIELDFLTDDLPKILYSMKTGADRVRQIVLSLHNFSRLDQAGMKQVDIHEGIDSTLLILQSRLQSSAPNKKDETLDIKVIKQYGEIPYVECYPGQMNQVFLNIINNAVDALFTLRKQINKTIYIKTEVVESNFIKVTIKDNGPGIDKEILSKVFDPFFTTKPVGKGIGLGLTISYQILQEHQGRIDIISEVGEGTEVIIELPIKTIK